MLTIKRGETILNEEADVEYVLDRVRERSWVDYKAVVGNRFFVIISIFMFQCVHYELDLLGYFRVLIFFTNLIKLLVLNSLYNQLNK